MEDNYSLQNYAGDDVLEFGSAMFKVGKFRQAIETALTGSLQTTLNETLKSQGLEINTKSCFFNMNMRHTTEQYWFREGVNCEVLKIGSMGWQKGKVRLRVSLEFCPDEPEVEETAPSNEIPQPESPLDDIRQMMNQENQQS
ncbi:hypothetical protein H6F98_28370 [Microcoleus sp. FACHB-SPT15]|uniref:KGK domain-containing protein n=1 Tax=Microcoleus sp. FACHB-SPT15 TaxID=2692830 RepID=UPI0017832783|nr:KGK domain-containing protein [Microcoleus sp. FACHB-SPT15]MBD1809343.1 hypothetical protein [Microcoleus sp. FACHB-SPT15]